MNSPDKPKRRRKVTNPLGLEPAKRDPRNVAKAQAKVAQEHAPALPPALLREGKVAQSSRVKPITDHKTPSTRHYASYTPDVQIRELSAHIKRNLHKIASLTARGRYDRAATVSAIVTQSRARLQSLVRQVDEMPIDPAVNPPAIVPQTRLVRKVKRYSRWNDK